MNHSLKAPFDLGKPVGISLVALSICLSSVELKSNQITVLPLRFISAVVHYRSHYRQIGGMNLKEGMLKNVNI